MNFAECPKLYIHEYYEDKINQVDLKCEKAILETKNVDETEILNKIRIDLVDKIRLAKQNVLERFDKISSQFTQEMCLSNIEKIKDEIFMDQYCLVFEAFERFPLFELKCGILVFSQFNDNLLNRFK